MNLKSNGIAQVPELHSDFTIILFVLQFSPAPEEANPDLVDAPLAQESLPEGLFSCCSSCVFEK